MDVPESEDMGSGNQISNPEEILSVHSDTGHGLKRQSHDNGAESAVAVVEISSLASVAEPPEDVLEHNDTPLTTLDDEEANGCSNTKQSGPQDQDTEAEVMESNLPEESAELEVEDMSYTKSPQEIPTETPTASTRETGAALLRQICDGTRSVRDDNEAARFLHTFYKSANRVTHFDNFRESSSAMECFEALWTYTQKPALFEKRAIRFINILRMRSSRLDVRKEHLKFWVSHLDENDIPAYFTYLALNSSLSKRAASAYGWLLCELLKLDGLRDAQFYQQCSREPRIMVLLQDHAKDKNTGHASDDATSSGSCDDIADFKDLPLDRIGVEWRKKKLLDVYVREYSELVTIMDELMTLTGLEPVKRLFMDTIDQYDFITKHGVRKKQILNTTFTGNPGLGKTRVAKLYSQLLLCLMEMSDCYDLTVEDGQDLYLEDYSTVKYRTQGSGQGVIMIDEATHLNQGSDKRLLILVSNMEKNRGAVHYILTGLPDSMESFRAANTRFQSLLPHNIYIDDHTISETFALLREEIKTTWDGRMKVEGGENGLFVRIAARRISKGRGCNGFGNFHAIERFMAKTRRRYASRLATATNSGQTDVDEMLLTKDDLLGPPPDKGVRNCEAWKTLHEMVGLEKVKRAVQSLVDRVSFNYQRELSELPILETNPNRLFLGNPGTGKTTVAKLYAEIMAKSGILSSSEVILRTPVDFTSTYRGETASKTKDLLEMARGKVLVIDEAYMMFPDSGDRNVSIHTSAIDTIVSEVQGIAGEDRAVLLLGYKDKMESMLQKGNPGLERRFPLSTAFIFEDYTRPELLEIFHKKMDKQGLSCTPDAVDVAMDLLDKMRRRPNFGNAGEVDNVLSMAKQQASLRFHELPLKAQSIGLVLQVEDFDPDYQRLKTATADISSLFRNVLECEHLVAKLQGYANTCENLRTMGIQPDGLIPFSFVFKGPSGTFKTSAARAFGKVFYDIGLLADSSVVDCSVTDLVGEYCGQTGVKTRELLERAIGKVLLIDEAYRLDEISKFGDEAIGELIDAMTKPRYMQKMVIILAGDEEKMNKFMLKHRHLRSRFAEDIMFMPLGVEQSYELLKRSVCLNPKLAIELGSDMADWEKSCKKILGELVDLPTWANGRDVTDILAKRLIGRVISRPLKVTHGQKTRFVCSGQDFHDELQKLCIERRSLTVQ